MMTAAAQLRAPAVGTAAAASTAAGAARTVKLLGVPVDAVTLDQAAEHIVRSARDGTGGWVII